ncbi:MAG: hypothetical protein V2A71_01465, partial [Candidatus Eisenbacteria bacterium]
GFLLLLATSSVAVCLYGGGYLIDFVPSLGYQHQLTLKFVLLLVPLVLVHVLLLRRAFRRAGEAVAPIKLVGAELGHTQVKDGTTRQSRRLQSC